MTAVVVLGSANMDLVVRQPRLPEPGETIFGTSLATVAGGKGLNQAVAAARGGAQVAFIGAVGRDAFGDALRQCLRDNAVDISGLVEVDVPTGTAHIAVLDGGENSIVVVAGANDAIEKLDDQSRDAIRGAEYVVAQLERPTALIAESFALARANGGRTVLTPAPVSRIAPELFALVDILIPNSGEACSLTGRDDDTEAALALSLEVGLVVMTRGSRGVVVAQGGDIVAELSARRVEPVDTTGAGDTFAGVFIARLVLGESLTDALAAAGVAASISVTRPGASTSMPTWREIEALLDGHIPA